MTDRESLAKTLGYLDHVRSAVFRGAHKKMGEIGEDWLSRSQDETPTLEGHLKRSGQHSLKLAQAGNNYNIKLTLSFGGGIANDYALYQHETEGLNHPRGGGPFYASKPLQDNIERYLKALAEQAQKDISSVKPMNF